MSDYESENIFDLAEKLEDLEKLEIKPDPFPPNTFVSKYCSAPAGFDSRRLTDYYSPHRSYRSDNKS